MIKKFAIMVAGLVTCLGAMTSVLKAEEMLACNAGVHWFCLDTCPSSSLGEIAYCQAQQPECDVVTLGCTIFTLDCFGDRKLTCEFYPMAE